MFSMKDLLRLTRVHTALATAAIPTAALVVSGGSAFQIVLVAIGAVLHHAWGFSLNEIMDVNIDRRSRHLRGKPLVSGAMTRAQAVVVSLICLALSYAYLITAGVIGEGGVMWPILFITAATLSGAVYDLFGKKFPLSDVFVSGWMFLLVISGASVAARPEELPFAVWALAGLSSLHILFNNSVEGGIKDISQDREGGARTFAVVTGGRTSKAGIFPGAPILAWGALLRGLFIISGAVASYLLSSGSGYGQWLPVLASFWGVAVFAHSLTFLKRRIVMDRSSLVRTFAVHELMSFSFSLIVLLPVLGPIWALCLFLAPLLWFAVLNRYMYATRLAPGV